MDIAIFFGLLFFSFFLAYFYFARGVIYLGVFSALIILFLGIILSATGYIEMGYTFSDVANKTTTGNITEFEYSRVYHAEPLALSRDMINAMGAIMMLIGMGMMMTFAYDVNMRRRRNRFE